MQPITPNPFFAHRTPGRSKMPLTDLEGRSLGGLTVRDSGADILLGDLRASLEISGRFQYAVRLGDDMLLSAEPSAGGWEKLVIRSGDKHYDARVSPLRNTATARSGEGVEAARISGGLLGLKYRLDFDAGDPEAPYLSLLLLYHLLLARSRAYRAIPAHLTPGGL